MEKIGFISQTSFKAVCSVALLVAAMYWLPLPHSIYPWIKFAVVAGSAIILAFVSSVHIDMKVSDALLFIATFFCAATALQIAIWALCGEYICYGYIDIVWLSPMLMGILFFLCRDKNPFSDFIILKSMLVASFLVIPLAAIKLLGLIGRLF